MRELRERARVSYQPWVRSMGWIAKLKATGASGQPCGTPVSAYKILSPQYTRELLLRLNLRALTATERPWLFLVGRVVCSRWGKQHSRPPGEPPNLWHEVPCIRAGYQIPVLHSLLHVKRQHRPAQGLGGRLPLLPHRCSTRFCRRVCAGPRLQRLAVLPRPFF